MVSSFILQIDIVAKDISIEGEAFREEVDQCLTYLDSLSGAFSRKPCTVRYYSPHEPLDMSEYWSVRAIVMISIGRVRALHLIDLYEAMWRLIVLELPNFEVQHQVRILEYS